MQIVQNIKRVLHTEKIVGYLIQRRIRLEAIGAQKRQLNHLAFFSSKKEIY
jgi:hypothetical protein